MKKILARMRRNPRDCRIEDLKVVAEHFGIAYRQNGTSHVGFRFRQGTLPVPAARPIAPVYVKSFLAQLDAMGQEESE